jgi:hypothetical protein
MNASSGSDEKGTPWPLRNGRVQEFAAERGLGRGYGRFKSGSVAESRRSAVSLDLLLVNLQNLIQRQKHRFHDVRF